MKMKKLTACFFVILFIFLSLCPAAAATDAPSEEASLTTDKRPSGANISCVYNNGTSQISISGTVTHDLFISYKDHTIRLYKALPWEEVEDILSEPETEPLAVIDMSIKFNFSVDAVSTADIFSKYVLVFVSEDGDIDYVGAPLYPLVSSEYSASNGDKSNYKGIDLSDSFISMKASPSLAVIDVELDRLLNSDFMGYLYTIDGESVFFDKSYTEYLDLRMRNLSASEADVYFRLLFSDEETGNYIIPDCSSETVIRQIYAACDFLAGRYGSHEYRGLRGAIISRSLDNIEDDVDDSFIEDYAERLAIYGIVVGNAVRQNIPSADIVYPFSNENSYSSASEDQSIGLGSRLIEGVCSYFDEYCADGFDFSLMLEADATPFGITNENIGYGIAFDAGDDKNYILPHNIGDFSLYLDRLERSYSSAPRTFMYYWNVDAELGGNALCSAYAYSYYKLFLQNKLTGFIVSLDVGETGSDAFSDLFNIFKYIDTANGYIGTEPLLSYFGVSSWSEIISPIFDSFKFDARTHITAEAMTELPNSIKGQYYYFDYSEKTGILPWYESVGSEGLSIDYSYACGRSLRAEFSEERAGEYSYIVCRDSYPENYLYTPYVVMNFSVEGDGDGVDGLFEVRLEMGNGASLVECVKAVPSGENSQMILDISDFSEQYLVEYIRISVRPISDSNTSYSFYLSSIFGASTEYDGEELDVLIEKERAKIRNLNSDDSIASNDGVTTVLVAIVIMSVILGVMLFFFLRHDDGADDRKTE